MPTRIPIQNIYYLLCYAWDTLDQKDIVDVSGIESNELQELFARVLIGGTRHVLKDGLDRDYQTYSEETARLRGRIDFDASLKHLLFEQARAHCHFDELSHNVLHNRILKTTLRILASADRLDKDRRSELLQLYRRLEGVEEVHLNRHVFRKVQLHRNISFYRFLINICELVHSALLMDEKSGTYKFRDFLRDEKKMSGLFESFVRNFYKLEQSEFPSVKSEDLYWDADPHDEQSLKLLPKMKTDISLRSPERTVIIDTKYYLRALGENRFGTDKVHSSNLYQIFSYLKNLEKKSGPDASAEGILLYPTVTTPLELSYTIQGHKIRVCTINLNQGWSGIKQDLLRLIQNGEEHGGARDCISM